MNDTKTPSPFRVLLVEDNLDDADLTREALRTVDVPLTCHVVGDGLQALAFLRRQDEFAAVERPDLILLDLNLPRLGGFEVLREIRKDPELTWLPVIILSTSEADEDIREAYALHANCYIPKKLDFHDFVEAIGRICDFWLKLAVLPKERRGSLPGSAGK